MNNKGFAIAPLPSSFMLTSMLGLLISFVWVMPASASFGVSFVLVFGAMFIASLVSMAKAEEL